MAIVGLLRIELYDVNQAMPLSEEELAADRAERWRKTHVTCGQCGREAPRRSYDFKLKSCRRCYPAALEKHLKLQAERRARAEREHAQFLEQERDKAIHKARAWLTQGQGAVIFDMETTGLDIYYDEPVQAAVVALDGQVLLDTLIRPVRSIPAEATEIHRIDDDQVKDAPAFFDIYPRLVDLLAGKTVIVYNADYDREILRFTARRHDCQAIEATWACAMKAYAAYVGEWSDYWGSFRYQKLQGDHSAAGDCLATLDLVRLMANARTSIEQAKDRIASWDSMSPTPPA